MVILDRDGKFMAAVNEPIERVIDPHLAEAIACHEALSWVKERGFTKVHFESDCLNVINDIKTHKLDLSYSGPIITQCRDWALTFQSFSCFIRCSANQIVHALARDSQSVRTYWDSIPPICIQHLVT